jgi:hypothetical protein
MSDATVMQDNATLFLCLRIIFTGLFIVTLVAGAWILKNREKLFGVDPQMPYENSGGRLYSKTLIFVIWAHAVAITGGFALMFS